MCYISLHRRCEDNSNDLILLRDKQESQTSICLRAVGRGNGCGKRRSGRGESKARNTAKCICSLGSLLLPPRQLLSGAFLQGLVLSLKTTAKSLTHSAQIQSPDIYSCFHNISEHLSINLSCKATIPLNNILSAAQGNGYHLLPAQRSGPKSADLYTWPHIPWLTPALFFH